MHYFSYLHIQLIFLLKNLLCTYLETTEPRRLDPMPNATRSFRIPPNVRNEYCGNDDYDDENDDDCDDDGGKKE